MMSIIEDEVDRRKEYTQKAQKEDKCRREV
jgi:hypothetical protein